MHDHLVKQFGSTQTKKEHEEAVDELCALMKAIENCQSKAIAFRDSFAGPFAEGAGTFTDGQLKSMAENWIDIEDQPMIIEAELEEWLH